jgi:signal transduction histidine kinase
MRQPDRALLQMLDTVGSQIGLFIERRHSEQVEREQAQALAALEERQRLARDLHDSVSQSLFSASVIAEMLPVLLSRDPEQAKSGLNELQHLTQDALTEMRALLVELRPSNGDLAALLNDLVERFRSRTKIDIQLNLHISDSITPEEQNAIYRITGEALNNIARHAAATQVSLRCIVEARRLELQIADNGRGFDPAHTPAGHFGLQGMQERAEAIGTMLHVHSTPGRGTRLSLIRTTGSAKR